MAWAPCLALLLLAAGPQSLAVDGTFRGKVIDPPANQPVVRGWIFIQGRNHMLRRVEVAHAVVVFGESVPASHRHKCNADCLSAGQEVRVTARQDSAGEWRAKLVEILEMPTQMAKIREKTRSLPNLTRDFSQSRVTGRSEPASEHPREKSKYQHGYAAL